MSSSPKAASASGASPSPPVDSCALPSASAGLRIFQGRPWDVHLLRQLDRGFEDVATLIGDDRYEPFRIVLQATLVDFHLHPAIRTSPLHFKTDEVVARIVGLLVA